MIIVIIILKYKEKRKTNYEKFGISIEKECIVCPNLLKLIE